MSTLATIGVLFAAYQFITAPPPGQAAPQVAQQMEQAVDLPTANTSDQPIRIGSAINLQPGRRVVVRDYDAQTGQGRFVLEVAAWAPVPNTTDEWELDAPRIGLRSHNGQAIDVTAEHGRLELRRGDHERLVPRRGRLWGDIKITIDRLSAAERQNLSPEQRDAPPGEERLVHVEAEDVDFDLEYARVTSAGRIRVRSAEAAIAFTGLALRYNDFDNTIENLEIPTGGTIELMGRGNVFRLAVPGTSTAVEKETPLASAAPVEPPRSARRAKPAVAPDGLPLFEPDEPKTAKPRPIVTYRAIFHDSVDIEQRDNIQATGRLRTDLLELLFDFGQPQREAVSRGQSPAQSADSSESASATASASERSATASKISSRPGDASGERMIVTWTGPLKVDLVPESQDPDLTSKGHRMHATATGDAVQIWSPKGEAICGKLDFYQETQFVELLPRAAAPDQTVVIRSADNGQIEGRAARFNSTAHTGTITGPGRLLDVRGGAGLAPAAAAQDAPAAEIQFGERLDIQLATAELTKTDSDTGAVTVEKHEYLQKATLVGGVRIAQAEGVLSAGQVDAEFTPSQPGQPPGQTIQHLYAKQDVHLTRGADRISSDELEIETGPDAAGQLVPRRAIARGNPVAEQGQRRISAAREMTVDLIRIERPPEALPTLEQAREIARQRGLDPDQIDWEAQRARFEKRNQRYDLGLARLQASGEIMVTDPAQPLEVIGESIDCRFADGRKLETAYVVGPASGPATVKIENAAIMGRTIELDATRPYAHVPGAGRLSFITQQDLDGKQLDKATPVVVTWSHDMTFRGNGSGSSTATFLGDVHAVSEDSTFDAPEMSIDFVDAPRSETLAANDAAAAGGAAGPAGWAFLAPLTARFTLTPRAPAHAARRERSHSRGADRALEMATAVGATWCINAYPTATTAGLLLAPLISNSLAGQPGQPRSDPLRIDGFAARQPVYILASGGVVALTSNPNPRTGNLDSRGRITGQRLAIDMRSKVMKIEGAGNLFIEDYQLPQPDKSAGEKTRTPFGGAGSDGPSQTYVAWAGSMSYDYANYGASFEREVTLIHRSGSKIVYGDQIFAVDKVAAAAFAKGRDAQLNADQLLVAFTRPEDRARAPGVGRMSGAEFRQFQAEGNVYFEDSGVSATATRMSYHRQQNTLWIYGKQGLDAEIIDQRRGYWSLKSPEIRWDRTTGRIESANARLIGN
ncbi:MAG TPA: hypothetical protein VGM03_20950 [Phycisphaerae bacterium]